MGDSDGLAEIHLFFSFIVSSWERGIKYLLLSGDQ